jgi:hypothetical protein
MEKMEESLSRTYSSIQVSIHGWFTGVPYGEDGRKPVQDLFWYPGQFPVQRWFSPHGNNWNQKQDFEFQDFNYIILNFVKKTSTCVLTFSWHARPGKVGPV